MKMIRVEEDSPDRCQSVFARGQCPYKREPNSEYCLMHGGNHGANNAKKAAVHDYKFQQVEWSLQNRINELAGSSNVKNLRGEIGILRMTLEAILGQIKTQAQAPLYVDKILATSRELKGLVESCQKIEERNKELLGKTEIYNIADVVINIVQNYITDPDQLIAIGEELYAGITGIICGPGSVGAEPTINNRT